MGALSFLKESVFAEDYASRKGFLQARDPRIKILMILTMLLVVLFSKSILSIIFIYVFCLILTICSSIDIIFFLKRTWFFIPLFSLCIALPALFNVFSPGDALVSFNFFGYVISITSQGLNSATVFFMRVLTSVSLVVLLTLTTRHYVLLKVLRIFKIPHIFVMTLGMCYRYIYLFIEMVQNTYLAIKSRVGFISSVKKGHKVVAWNIASLWQRSFELHNQVYNAMLSRGYNGEPEIIDEFHVSVKDVFWFMATALFIGGIWQVRFLN